MKKNTEHVIQESSGIPLWCKIGHTHQSFLGPSIASLKIKFGTIPPAALGPRQARPFLGRIDAPTTALRSAPSGPDALMLQCLGSGCAGYPTWPTPRPPLRPHWWEGGAGTGWPGACAQGQGDLIDEHKPYPHAVQYFHNARHHLHTILMHGRGVRVIEGVLEPACTGGQEQDSSERRAQKESYPPADSGAAEVTFTHIGDSGSALHDILGLWWGREGSNTGHGSPPEMLQSRPVGRKQRASGSCARRGEHYCTVRAFLRDFLMKGHHLPHIPSPLPSLRSCRHRKPHG